MPEFVKVTTEDEIVTIADLAYEIWNEHYAKIIGQAQVDYMLARFQSKSAIREQIEKGFLYYIIRQQDEDIGYLGIYSEDSGEKIDLSKLYIKEQYRGNSLGREAVDFIEELGREMGKRKICLTVNKYNPAIAAYESMGFKRKEALVQDIGADFVMDDYLYEKIL